MERAKPGTQAPHFSSFSFSVHRTLHAEEKVETSQINRKKLKKEKSVNTRKKWAGENRYGMRIRGIEIPRYNRICRMRESCKVAYVTIHIGSWVYIGEELVVVDY